MPSLDNTWFRNLYDDNYVVLCQLSYGILRDAETAREVVQNSFVEVWQRRETIQDARAYLYRVVYRAAWTQRKRGSMMLSLEGTYLEKGHSDSETLEFLELQRLIEKGIEELPEKCREIFLLSREGGLTYAEIALRLGQSPKTVENQMAIALKRLKESLARAHHIPSSKIFSIFF
jgi:RNA polymerase sigma-70 factor, ECF subfamily